MSRLKENVSVAGLVSTEDTKLSRIRTSCTGQIHERTKQVGQLREWHDKMLPDAVRR